MINLLNGIDKHLVQIGKIYVDLQQQHPIEFAMAPGAMNIIYHFWIIANQQQLKIGMLPDMLKKPMERIIIQSLLLILNSIKNVHYTTLTVGSQNLDGVKSARQIIDRELLTSEFIHAAVEALVTRFIMLNKEDLEKWKDDPEGWMGDIEADHWMVQIRVCILRTCLF